VRWQNIYWVRNRLFSRQIAYVWALVFIGIVVYAFVWFSQIWWLWLFIEAFEDAVTLDPAAQSVVEILKAVIAYHPLIAVFGWLLWGFLNSMRRDVRTYEV